MHWVRGRNIIWWQTVSSTSTPAGHSQRLGQGDETSSCNSPFLPHPRRQVTAGDSGKRMKPQGFRAGGRLQIQRRGLQAFGLDGQSCGTFNTGAGTDYHCQFSGKQMHLGLMERLQGARIAIGYGAELSGTGH